MMDIARGIGGIGRSILAGALDGSSLAVCEYAMKIPAAPIPRANFQLGELRDVCAFFKRDDD